MHVYHFTGYERGALKRLMGRYATREEEIDRMLRAHIFIDLHAILKRSVRASVEQYSLKALEVFHNCERKVALDSARTAMRLMQHCLELEDMTRVDIHTQDTIVHYNADDCYSTWSLRNWLEGSGVRLKSPGLDLPRPVFSDGVPPEIVGERQQRIATLTAQLQAGIPDNPEQRDEEQSARWLLSNLLDWHRRELKSEWWEFFRLGDLTDEELLDEKYGLSGLHHIERLGVQRNIPTDRYGFEKQETCVCEGDKLCAKGEVQARSLTSIWWQEP